MEDKRLFLLDGHALVYRAHFAFITRPLINSKGVNTSAVTGFVRTLWDLMVNQKPTHIAVAFDPKGGTFRHEYYPQYKANRDAQPEDITVAMKYIPAIVEAFNIPVVMAILIMSAAVPCIGVLIATLSALLAVSEFREFMSLRFLLRPSNVFTYPNSRADFTVSSM